MSQRDDLRDETPSAPDVKVSYAAAGRETLSAIEEELFGPPFAEGSELGESGAPAAQSSTSSSLQPPDAKARPPQTTLPYGDRISNAPGAGSPGAVKEAAELEIFELFTFIIRGQKPSELSSDALRRRFVEQHLLSRMARASIDQVERIEVTPWTTHGTLVMRVWVRS